MTRLDGKVALVTGAASGIGRACALRLEAEGATVAGLDVGDPADHDDQPGGRPAFGAGFHTASVTDADAVGAAVSAVVDGHRAIDVLVQAAGVAGGGPVHLLGADEWHRIVEVNLTGTMLVARAVLRASMVDRRSGSIINIASVEGLQGTEGGSAYNASKGGVVTLTKSMAMDYGRAGIRVNCVCPGFIDTPMSRSIFDMAGMETHRDRLIELHQLGRFGQPSEIAAAVAFLAGDDASFVTGHALVVDGGLTAGQRTGVSDLFGLG